MKLMKIEFFDYYKDKVCIIKLSFEDGTNAETAGRTAMQALMKVPKQYRDIFRTMKLNYNHEWPTVKVEEYITSEG